MISSVSHMVESFIATNGVRRFETGASGTYDSIKDYLAYRDWILTSDKHGYYLRKVATTKRYGRMKWDAVVAFVDEFRASEGKTTMRRTA